MASVVAGCGSVASSQDSGPPVDAAQPADAGRDLAASDVGADGTVAADGSVTDAGNSEAGATAALWDSPEALWDQATWNE